MHAHQSSRFPERNYCRYQPDTPQYQDADSVEPKLDLRNIFDPFKLRFSAYFQNMSIELSIFVMKLTYQMKNHRKVPMMSGWMCQYMFIILIYLHSTIALITSKIMMLIKSYKYQLQIWAHQWILIFQS